MQLQTRKAEITLNIIEVAKKIKKKVAEVSYGDYETYGRFSHPTLATYFGTWINARKVAARANLAKLQEALKEDTKSKQLESQKAAILKLYRSLVKKTGSSPSANDMVAAGCSRDSITRSFGSLSALDELVRRESPDMFHDIHVSSLFSADSFEALDEVVAKKRRFIISTAVQGCYIHEGFRDAIAAWEQENDGALLVMITADPAKSRDKGDRSQSPHERYGKIDARLKDEFFILQDTALNSNLRLSTLKTSAKMINPLTGLKRLIQKNGNLIVASPKQVQECVPAANFKLPHVGMATGAITLPDYSTEYYMSERLAYIADHDHVIGAIIVEIEDGDLFHYRQVQAAADGSFYDIAGLQLKKYTPNGVEVVDLAKENAAAFVLGDWHSGETDPVVAAAWKDLCAIVQPDYIVIHDGFNGLAINHHEQSDTIKRAQRSISDQLDLESELRGYARDLDVLSSLVRKRVVVVKSNHDDFLYTYLKKGLYIEDPQNHYFSLDIAKAAIRGEDPVQFAIEKVVGVQDTSKIKWLKRNEDFKVAKIQLGAHGDKGPNGSRGTLALMEQSFRASVTGHSHVPQILRGAWSVGTSSYLQLDYNEDSPSSWMNTSCIVYPNGQRQLINCVFGKYALGCQTNKAK
jgi:hypothetical protein